MAKYEINKVRIANAIKDIRMTQGLTMEEFSAKLGITKGTINNYEKGRISPGEMVIRKLLKISSSQKSVNEFLYGTAREYLDDIFWSVESSGIFSFVYNDLLSKLEDELNKEKLMYGNEAGIIIRASELEPSLKYNKAFLQLWDDYKLQPIKFEIESNDDFKYVFLPRLDKLLNDLPNKYDKETALEETLYFLSGYKSFINNGYNASYELSDYFTGDELDKISQSEDLKRFHKKFSRAKSAFSAFLSKLENSLNIPLSYVVRKNLNSNSELEDKK